MTLERYLRLIAGAIVLVSLALGHWVNSYWYLFTAFVGSQVHSATSKSNVVTHCVKW
jgi:hypothetical protein